MKIDIKQLEFIDDNLRTIVQEIEKHFGVEFTITSLYRIANSGVHGTLPLRGIDLRCRDENLGIFVQSYVNRHWDYDASRPNKKCCLFHSVGRGFHLHVQTHPKTERRI